MALCVCALLVIAAVAVYNALWPRALIARPVVSIRTPGEGQQVIVGQPVAFSSLARSRDHIVRLEFWADGQLQEIHKSSLPGGASLLPLAANWQATAPGTHTLAARAFDSQGRRAYASVTLEAVQPADQGSDGALDSADANPDGAGSDAVAGPPLPAEEQGEASSSQEPASPPPDADGDGVADERDLCPEAAGPAASGGCPPSSAGDRDGDGVADDVDLCPDEAGLPEHGGCPPPGSGADDDRDGLPDEEEGPAIAPGLFRFLMPLQSIFVPVPKAMTAVEFEATGFLLGQDYDEVVCYACLGDGAGEQIGPFRRLEGNSWDVAEYLGAAVHRRLMLPEGEPLRLRMQCTAYDTYTAQAEAMPDGTWGDAGGEQVSFDLGTLERSHPPEDWNGLRLQGRSVRDAPPVGLTFLLDYRICADDCEEQNVPAPSLGLYDRGGDHALAWTWDGDPEAIDGFFVRCNCDRMGFYTRWAPKDWRILPVSDLEPECGDTCSFTVAAHRNVDGMESPLSNAAVWEGRPCGGAIQVDFLSVHNYQHSSFMCGRGPIYGSFSANGELLWFNGSDPGYFNAEEGYRIEPESMYGSCGFQIQDMFDSIRQLQQSNPTFRFEAPSSATVFVPMQPGEDLTVGARIYDYNPEGGDTCLADAAVVFPASYLLGEDFNRTFEDRSTEYDDMAGWYMLDADECTVYFRLRWVARPQTE